MVALSTTEAAALMGVDERTVRKEVEHGILDAGSPPRFAEVALVYLRACASFAFHLDARDRKRLYADVSDASRRGIARLDLGSGWTLDVGAITADVRRRVADFEAWRAGLVVRDDILGGEPVFPASRLAVRRVAELVARGASAAEVRDDYPSLDDRDIEFATLFAAAYPRIGRPRGQASAG